jgi:hypothetical protein
MLDGMRSHARRVLTEIVVCVCAPAPVWAQVPALGTTEAAGSEGAAQQASGTTTNPVQNLTLNLTLESYYQYNWNRPAGRVNLLRAYDTRANSFSIQQAAFVLESAPDRAVGRPFGLRLDLQFGQATEALQGAAANEPRPDVYRHVWQAFGSYVFPGTGQVRVDVGKFASNLGFETNYAKDNHNFSRAFLFNFLPYYHQGLRLTLSVNDRLSIQYMLTNGTQQSEDFNEGKSNQVALTLTPKRGLTWTVNYYAGQEQPDGGEPNGPDGWFRVFDTYASYTPTERVSLGVDVSRTTNQRTAAGPSAGLTGVGAYARAQLTPADALAVRYEHLSDDGLFGGIAQKLQEMTVTVERKVADGFLARAEFRRDWSDTPFFLGRRSTDPRKRDQNTLLVGVVWWVGIKTGAR